MMRRDDLTFRQEMKFRNKLVEYLTDWIMGNSHQLNVQGDVFSMSRYYEARGDILISISQSGSFIYTPCLEKNVPPLACYNFDAHDGF